MRNCIVELLLLLVVIYCLYHVSLLIFNKIISHLSHYHIPHTTYPGMCSGLHRAESDGQHGSPADHPGIYGHHRTQEILSEVCVVHYYALS